MVIFPGTVCLARTRSRTLTHLSLRSSKHMRESATELSLKKAARRTGMMLTQHPHPVFDRKE